MLTREKTFLGRPSYLSSRSNSTPFDRNNYVASASRSRIGSLPTLLHNHDEKRANLKQEAEMLQQYYGHAAVGFGVILLSVGLQIFTAKVQKRIFELSQKEWAKWVEKVFGDEGFKADARTKEKVVMTMKELITKFGIAKVKKEFEEEVKRCFDQARTGGFRFHDFKNDEKNNLKKALRKAWSTAGQSLVEYVARRELELDSPRIFISNIDSTTEAGRKLINDLKAMGIKGAKDPNKPVVGTKIERRSIGYTEGHWVVWFWLICVWYPGEEQFVDVPVEYVLDNVKDFHEGMHEVSMYIPTVKDRVKLDMLAWTSTWESVLLIESANSFEARFTAWAKTELAARSYALQRAHWDLATCVTTAVLSVIAGCAGGVPAGIAMAVGSDLIQSLAYYCATGDGSMQGMCHVMYKMSVDPSAEHAKQLCTREFVGARRTAHAQAGHAHAQAGQIAKMVYLRNYALALEFGVPVAGSVLAKGCGTLLRLRALRANSKLLQLNATVTKATRYAGESLRELTSGVQKVSRNALKDLPCLAVTSWGHGIVTVAPTFKFFEKTGRGIRLACTIRISAKGLRRLGNARQSMSRIGRRYTPRLFTRKKPSLAFNIVSGRTVPRQTMLQRLPDGIMSLVELRRPLPIAARHACHTSKYGKFILRTPFRLNCAEMLSSNAWTWIRRSPQYTIAFDVKRVRGVTKIVGLKPRCQDCRRMKFLGRDIDGDKMTRAAERVKRTGDALTKRKELLRKIEVYTDVGQLIVAPNVRRGIFGEGFA